MLNSRLIQYLILFGAICVELMVYRRGIADSLIYIRGGESFLAGVNPYLQDSRFMSGPSGSGFVALVANSVAAESFPWVWQGLNLLGLYIFVYFVISITKRPVSNVVPVTLILYISSPCREMLTNNQITGFALGVFAIGSLLLSDTTYRWLRWRFFTGGLLCALALEIKPNLLIPIALVIVIFKLQYLLSYISGFIMIFILNAFHSTLTLYFHWVKVLFQGVNQNGNIQSSVSVWSFLKELSWSESLVTILNAIFLLTALTVIIVARKTNCSFENALLASAWMSITFPYAHYLDFIIIIPFVVIKMINTYMTNFLSPLLLLSLLLPNIYRQPSKQLICAAILIFLIFVRHRFIFSRTFTVELVKMVSIFSCYAYLIGFVNMEPRRVQELVFLQSYFLITIFVLMTMRKVSPSIDKT